MPSTHVDIGRMQIERASIQQFGIDTHRVPQGGLAHSMQRWQQARARARSVVEARMEAPRRYLFIVTHQGERLCFFEHEVDIDSALARLQHG